MQQNEPNTNNRKGLDNLGSIAGNQDGSIQMNHDVQISQKHRM